MPAFTDLITSFPRSDQQRDVLHGIYLQRQFHIALAQIAMEEETDVKGALEICIKNRYDTLFDL